MEETYNTKAIILNRQPFRERDSRVTIFSLERGKLILVARGTKKITSKNHWWGQKKPCRIGSTRCYSPVVFF